MYMSPTDAMASPAAAAKARPRKSMDMAERASDDSDEEDWLPQKKRPCRTSVPDGDIL